MHITVNDLLNNQKLTGLNIISGHRGVNNLITGVNMLENPDTFDWLRSGDFLLTTGYVIQQNPEIEHTVIQELAERNCSGLGFKLKRYYMQVPESMIRASDKLKFPILEIPYHMSLSEVSGHIIDMLTNYRRNLIERAMGIHDMITEIVLNGGSLLDICRVMARTVGNPVILLDSSFRLLEAVDVPDNPKPIAGWLSLNSQEPVFDEDFVRDIPTNPELFRKSIKIVQSVADQRMVFRIVPVNATHKIYGYIVVVESLRKLTMLDYITLEQSATVIALDRLKTRKIEEAKLRVRDTFFDDLLSNNIHSVNAFNGSARMFGLDPKSDYYVILLRPHQTIPRSRDELRWDDHLSERMCERISEVYRQLRRTPGVTFFNGDYIALHKKMPGKAADKLQDVKQVTRQLLDLTHKGQALFRCGLIGRAYPLIQAKESYSEAKACQIYVDRADTADLIHYQDFELFNMIFKHIDSAVLADYCRAKLAPLVQSDQTRNMQLTKTLETYFRYHGNVTQSSEALFIHRNTLMYRLKIIEDMLDFDKEDSADYSKLLELQMALQICQLLPDDD